MIYLPLRDSYSYHKKSGDTEETFLSGAEPLPMECGGDLLRTKESDGVQSTPIRVRVALTPVCTLECVQSDYTSPYMGDKEVEIA